MEITINIDKIMQLLNSNTSDYSIAQQTGITRAMIGKYKNGQADIMKASLTNVMALHDYALKIEEDNKMKEIRSILYNYFTDREVEARIIGLDHTIKKQNGYHDISYVELGEGVSYPLQYSDSLATSLFDTFYDYKTSDKLINEEEFEEYDAEDLAELESDNHAFHAEMKKLVDDMIVEAEESY